MHKPLSPSTMQTLMQGVTIGFGGAFMLPDHAAPAATAQSFPNGANMKAT